MSKTAQKTNPKLWEKVKSEVTRSGKGGEPGQWSARKAQFAVQEYKKRGGGYLGKPSDEDWSTKSGRDSRQTDERYSPKKARKTLSESEFHEASAKKRADMKKGERSSSQSEEVAKTTARQRSSGKSPAKAKRPKQNKNELLKQARYLDIEGRSNMLKTELQEAIRLAKH
jgi:hypothetical protein